MTERALIGRHYGAAAILLLSLRSVPVCAQNDASTFEITPFGGYRFGGTFNVEEPAGSYELRDSSSIGLILNWEHTAVTQWEVLYSQQRTEAEFNGVTVNDPLIDIDLHVLQLGGTYQFDGEMAKPYLAATIGGTHARVRSNSSKSDTFWSGSIGLGVLVSPNSTFGLRLEARYHGALVNSSSTLFCQTGPDINVCAARIVGDLVSQVETFAGVVIRF